ncbi:hypothetical protein PRUPE_1G385400 [Prunus persica]|uniref:Uncharacterized protein n=1 Tax=Prunus persica TaxID=3760 RepID=A0A251R9Q1_PRUPE|nr:hypothetical protein PRUPE_1G385400 [Prunus persica]
MGSSKPTKLWIWHVRQSRGMGVAFVECMSFLLVLSSLECGLLSSVLCFLADHSSWILGLYIVSLLLRLGRMGMLLRGVWYFLVYGLFLLDFIRYDSSKKICAATFVS